MESLKSRRAQVQWTDEDRRKMVIACQTSKSIAEVSAKLLMAEDEVRQKIAYLRRNGVKLRKFKQPKPDFSGLQKLAREWEGKSPFDAEEVLAGLSGRLIHATRR